MTQMTCSNLGPYDLNIPVDCASTTSLKDLVKRAVSLGYLTVALNTEVSQHMFATRKEKNKKTKAGDTSPTLEDFPPPTKLELEPSDYPTLAARGLSPVILNRLTINITSNDFMIAYNKSNIAKQYDILAINCGNSPALTALLKSSFRFDLLTFNPDSLVGGIKWTRKLYFECVEKNVHFEISYCPMIRDSMTRRRVISQSHTYHSVGKSRAILLTSQARRPLELRAPEDVANLAFVLGLSENQGKAAVSQAGYKVHKAAMGRRMGPFRVRVEKLSGVNGHLVPDEELIEGSDVVTNQEIMEPGPMDIVV